MKTRWLTYPVTVQFVSGLAVGSALSALPGDVERIIGYSVNTEALGRLPTATLNTIRRPIARVAMEFNDASERLNIVCMPDWNDYNEDTGQYDTIGGNGGRLCDTPCDIVPCNSSFRLFAEDMLGPAIWGVITSYSINVNLLAVCAPFSKNI